MSYPYASVLPMNITEYIKSLTANLDLTADEASALIASAVNDKAYL